MQRSRDASPSSLTGLLTCDVGLEGGRHVEIDPSVSELPLRRRYFARHSETTPEKDFGS